MKAIQKRVEQCEYDGGTEWERGQKLSVKRKLDLCIQLHYIYIYMKINQCEYKTPMRYNSIIL